MIPIQLNRNNVIIEKKINRGSFAEIYSAIDFATSLSLAIKIERPNISVPTIDAEISILRRLQSVESVPAVLWSGKINNRSAFITHRLGASLAEHLSTTKIFSISTIVLIASELISILEQIHSKGVLHLDLKPANILTGMRNNRKALFLVDFNLSKQFLDKNGQHIPLTSVNEFNGNLQFASVNSHEFLENSRKDDLESLGYLLYFLYHGKLPWDKITCSDIVQKIAKVGEAKKRFLKSIKNNNELPSCLQSYFEEISNIGFYDKPNYKNLSQIFKKGVEKDGSKVMLDVELSNEFGSKGNNSKKISDESTNYLESSKGTIFSEKISTLSKILEQKDDGKITEECDYDFNSMEEITPNLLHRMR